MTRSRMWPQAESSSKLYMLLPRQKAMFIKAMKTFVAIRCQCVTVTVTLTDIPGTLVFDAIISRQASALRSFFFCYAGLTV